MDHALEQGVIGLGLIELLALILGPQHCDREPLDLAAQLLSTEKTLAGLTRATARGFLSHTPLDPSAGARLAAAFELGKRATAPVEKLKGRPLDPRLVYEWGRRQLAHLLHEEVWILCVDASSRLMSTTRVGRGGLAGCSLLPRDVLGPVLREGAPGFLLVHNHPSGDPTPSYEDIHLTRALGTAATLIGSPLIDHVIIGHNCYASLFELGLLDKAVPDEIESFRDDTHHEK